MIISKILSVTIAVPLQVLLSSASPPSNGFWFEHRHPQCNYLARMTNKTREQSTTNQERPQINRQQSMGRANKHQKNTKGKGLSPHKESSSLGLERNRSGCLLSTSSSHSLASTSWADSVCSRTDQFIRAQVQWQPASCRTVILELIKT